MMDKSSTQEEYIEELRSHLVSFDNLYGFNNGGVIQNMFDANVRTVFSYEDGDYQGYAFVVYFYKGKYVRFQDWFGSCSYCDDWLYVTSSEADVESMTAHFDKLFRDVEIVDDLSDITTALVEEYCDTRFKTKWTAFAEEQGFLDLNKQKAEAKRTWLDKDVEIE